MDGLLWWGGAIVIVVALLVAVVAAWARKPGVVGVAVAIAGVPIIILTWLQIAPWFTTDPVITNLEDGDRVGICTSVRGTGELAKGKALVLAVRAEGDPRTYFEGDVSWVTDETWQVSAEVGDREEPLSARGAEFIIFPVVADAAMVQYLSGTSPVAGDTWWSSEGSPPGAEPGEGVKVRGTGSLAECTQSAGR